MSQNLPLQGLTVLALEQAVAAPYCTSRLADAGARVIKIERPEGDFARGYDAAVNGLSSYFAWLNRGKESLVADIKDLEDARLLHAILARADVFVQNLAPGAAARAGFGSAELRARHPRLITVDISGYGPGHTSSDMKAYDLLVQAESGLAGITGHPAGPGRVGVSVCDVACGMDAHAAVLEALIARGITGWRTLDREMAYPTEFVTALTESGYLSVLIPEEYGGAGLPLSAAAAILEEVQRAGCNGGACHAQMYTMGTLLRHGSGAQKAKYLPAIAEDHLRLQAFGVTEPTSGTDTGSLKTTARREGDHYVVNGQKIWTSRAEHSDLMLLLARTTPRREGMKRTDGLSVLLVDMREARGNGLTIRPIRTMMNHATTEVFFDNLRVPAENLIGEEGRGFRYIPSGMNAERILIAAECVGDAKWFIDRAKAYAGERSVFGRPIGANQGVQFPIARAYANMRAAELMVREALTLYEGGANPGAEANMAKMLAADASFEAANACIQTHGGFGFTEEYDVERKFRETRLYQVAPISTNLILAYLSEHVLGLPRSY